MEISLRQTKIKPTFIRQLMSKGIILESHLYTFNARRLSQKTKLSLDDCEQILAAVKPKRPHYVMQASELMLKPFDCLRTPIKELNKILGGGIKCGEITEISGEAGAGKSDICAKIAAIVMLPKEHDGLDGDVLLIHTEGEGKLKLGIKRFITLAESVDNTTFFNNKLHVKECSNEIQLLELVNRLPTILDQKPTVKLVIIDSITCAFISIEGQQQDYEYYERRSLGLTKLIKMLASLAWDRRIAVLATNHVSFNFKSGQLRPALGEIWSHMCQTKIYLEKKNSKRLIHVTKGATSCPLPVPFIISNNLYD